ncbi:DUF1850 domain-containing protein [Phyllobacterium sp. K27]
MSLCILAGGKTVALAISVFTLSWTHSVEKIEWKENWQIRPAGLVLELAQVKGSGAGMEPGENATLKNGWWVWAPEISALPDIRLAASGKTGSGWRLCHVDGCQELGSQAVDPIILRPCSGD